MSNLGYRFNDDNFDLVITFTLTDVTLCTEVGDLHFKYMKKQVMEMKIRAFAILRSVVSL